MEPKPLEYKAPSLPSHSVQVVGDRDSNDFDIVRQALE